MIGSLGQVTVSSPGILVRATVNLTNLVSPPRVACQWIEFQVLPSNAGKVYICLIGKDQTGTNSDENRLYVLHKPVSSTTGPFTSWRPGIFNVPSGLNAADFYIDADTPGDGVLITYGNQ